MLIILLAIIGSTIKAGVAYWVCFGFYCAVKVIQAVISVIDD